MSHKQALPTVGGMAPNFEANTTSGPFRFHHWVGESWSIVFVLPGSVQAMTELTQVARNLPDIERRGMKIVGLSRNWRSESTQWQSLSQHYSQRPGSGKDVQIIADDQGRISSLYGMSLPTGNNARDTASTRNTAILIDPKKIIRRVLTYPSSLSNGLSQLLSLVDNSSGLLQEIPTGTFGLDSKGRGKIYNDKVQISGGGVGTTVGVVQAAAGVVHNVDDTADGAADVVTDTGGGGGSPSLNSAVSTATDYIQHALNVMDSLADLGKVMPFVAPAFVIIKAIIAVEQRARDVDAKCTDLVQRITFMLSHLPALKKIKVTDSTRQVIDHMNDVLKKAAALIQTYRKQNAIARRLSVHNKDRFASCAASLKDCTNDLTVSLQIHQSMQLDILTRPVPSDPEDEAAEKFVAAHGGLEAVKENEELVKQFAAEMKLSMDEKVMEQLNSNITEVLQQNQDRLEQSLNESVSASVIDGIKGLAAQMNESAKEQKFICVQCDREYHESTNGEKSCSFHRAEYDSEGKTYACCNTQNPCQAGRHRSEHHYDYLYGNFFSFARNISEYDRWVYVQDFNLDTSELITASVSRLLRWKYRGAAPALPTILIKVGQVSISTPYLFRAFNTHDLEVASRVAEITHQTVLFRTSHSEEQYAMLEWVLSAEGVIIGINITVKASTSPAPFIRFCSFDITTATLTGEIQTLSEGGLRPYRPSTPYILPEVQRVSAILPEKAPREVRKNFKPRTSPNLPVVLKVVSDPPLESAGFDSNSNYEIFTGTISVFNKHQPKSMESISISSVTPFYRFIGDETYKPGELIQSSSKEQVIFPISIEPRQTWIYKFNVGVPLSAEERKIQTGDIMWRDLSIVARQRPLRIKLVLTDVEEEECSLVLDYVSPVVVDQAKSKDIAFFYIDDPFTFKRYGVHIAQTPSEKVSSITGEIAVQIGPRWPWLFELDLQKTVHKALKMGESEVDLSDLDIGQTQYSETPSAWSWKCWALVDLSCQRVYAFKILITKDIVGTKGFACLGYVPCPSCSNSQDEIRPIQYAKETIKFPELEPYVAPPSPPFDDLFDDVPPEAPKATMESVVAEAGSLPQLAILEKLDHRLASIESSLSRLPSMDNSLASIDNTLSRLGASIEQLVEVLKTK
ncbi:hypothetical protein GYMLUDRAFT_208552 [Collybiopsis luxurians FD-317 M1]|uniref:Alkyl hydroperoxide reductase subunit C/ Thiol specific antioxidant domain-containing protein n=1 Tax=Collybiopsis luxurians FD-317 M1 TaxID=944289 RepID=A0A0D0AMV1_9AGAR|nr:hypothetical protein GYMLUDRAFT_208552 [Collybiopsis luxurians FD-317 M1]